jgi:hypothetical protein
VELLFIDYDNQDLVDANRNVGVAKNDRGTALTSTDDVALGSAESS